jgi:bacteriocin biosynthesis cyclodehydratase domain-containing protein
MDSLPRRPVLLPGLHVLERGDGELQVGLDPARAVVLPASDAVRRTLAVLRVAGPAADADAESLHGLHRLGLVADAGRLPRPSVPRLVVHTFGATPWPGLHDLLRTVGLELVPTTADAALALVAGVGEPDRDLLDPYVRDGVPHLVLRMTEGDAVVGPFVVPGRTACLRCIDAHHAADDARWPLLVAQQAARTSRLRDDAVPEPVDPALAQLALAWAARDLFSRAAGRAPASWSATIRLPPDLAEAEAVAWLRHPECGCWWNEPA